MNYLLDTVVFLWMIFDQKESISSRALRILEEEENLYLSSISLWEIAIKYSLGRLKLKEPPKKWLPELIFQMDLKPLEMTQRHALEVAELPYYHRDPFDRLLAAQARLEEMTLISPDKIFKKYYINVIG